MLLPVALVVAASMLNPPASEAAPPAAAEPLVLPAVSPPLAAPTQTDAPTDPASEADTAAAPSPTPATTAAAEPAPEPTTTPASTTPEAPPDAPATPEPAPARESEVPFPFQQWRMRAGLGVVAGLGNIVIGARFGVFVFDGLLVGIDLQQWTGKPAITGVGGELRYVFWMVPVVQPYVGVLYDHFFLWNGQPSAGFVGGRLGLVWVTKSGVSAWLGGVYERAIKGCLQRKKDSPTLTVCELIYPELSVSLAF